MNYEIYKSILNAPLDYDRIAVQHALIERTICPECKTSVSRCSAPSIKIDGKCLVSAHSRRVIYRIRPKYDILNYFGKNGQEFDDCQKIAIISMFYSQKYQNLLKERKPALYVQTWWHVFVNNPMRFIEETGLNPEAKRIKKLLAEVVAQRMSDTYSTTRAQVILQATAASIP